MALINKFFQAILCLSLILLVFCITFVNVFKSNQLLTQTLDKADFYTAASKLMASQINAQITGNDKEVALAKQSIEQGISSALARSTLQPMQIALVSWLTSNQDNLKLELDMQSIKTKVTSSVDSAELKFSLTKLIPDRLELTDSKNLQPGDLESLKRVKSFYKFANDAIPVLAIVFTALAAMLLILNIRRGSKKFTSFLLPAAAAAIIGLVMVGIGYPLEGFIKINSSMSQQELGVNLSLRLLMAVTQQTLWYYIAIGIISVSGIIIARVVFKKRDKKLKDKKK